MILPAYWLVAVIRIWAFHPDSSPFEPLCIQIIFHKIRFVKGKFASFTEHWNCKLSYFHIEEVEPKPKTKTETYFFICPALLYKKLSRNKIWHLLNGRLIDFLYRVHGDGALLWLKGKCYIGGKLPRTVLLQTLCNQYLASAQAKEEKNGFWNIQKKIYSQI